MRILLTALFLTVPATCFAQDATEDRSTPPPVIELPAPVPVPVPVPQADPRQPALELAPSPATDPESDTDAEVNVDPEDILPENIAPDYSQLSPTAERNLRLDDLFIKLAKKTDAQSANLVAEEIVAIWMESGSASVNLLLRRGSDAAASGNPKVARIMYNHAVDLSPEFAEAWARSARLALTQKDYNRALNESLKALTLEPRHFYTLWTLGNVFEALGRQDDALEAYREANVLYPELKAVKDRLTALEKQVDGTVL